MSASNPLCSAHKSFFVFLAEPKQPVAKFQKFRVSKFKHVTGKPLHKSNNIENVQRFDQSLSHESNGLQAYDDLVAYPIAGPGGQIAVVKVANILYFVPKRWLQVCKLP